MCRGHGGGILHQHIIDQLIDRGIYKSKDGLRDLFECSFEELVELLEGEECALKRKWQLF
ncbi:Fur-regulated basic protein FbpA [Bacillus mycoides]|uniref:Fur-regulated basic protein FbpA n=1 Tax=Bacillus mycoides TaxID=1405 RepID=UPI002AA0DD5A|nr:Fur-regulated basic protein FbpA [Bacillus mycoides]